MAKGCTGIFKVTTWQRKYFQSYKSISNSLFCYYYDAIYTPFKQIRKWTGPITDTSMGETMDRYVVEKKPSQQGKNANPIKPQAGIRWMSGYQWKLCHCWRTRWFVYWDQTSIWSRQKNMEVQGETQRKHQEIHHQVSVAVLLTGGWHWSCSRPR